MEVCLNVLKLHIFEISTRRNEEIFVCGIIYFQTDIRGLSLIDNSKQLFSKTN